MAKVVIYSKDFCPYCDKAKHMLNDKGVAFTEIDLTDKPDEIAVLKKRTGMMTLPQIFINDQLIGGFSDMAELDQKNELDSLLRS